MRKSQLEFYQSLSEQDKLVLHLAALKAELFEVYSLQDLMTKVGKASSRSSIDSLLQRAYTLGLLTANNYYSSKKYMAQPAFMVAMLPNCKGMEAAWRFLQKNVAQFHNSYYFRTDLYYTSMLRDCLYTLLFLPEQYAAFEQRFLQISCDPSGFAEVLRDERYAPHLSRISPTIAEPALRAACSTDIIEMRPLSESMQMVQRVCEACGLNAQPFTDALCGQQQLLDGRFEEALKYKAAEPDSDEVRAIAALTAGNVDEALRSFTKEIKYQNRNVSKSPMATVSVLGAFYYVVALLCKGAPQSTLVFRKVEQWIGKKNNTDIGYAALFAVTVAFALGQKREKYEGEVLAMQIDIVGSDITVFTLMRILALYLSDEKPDSSHTQMLAIAQQACDSGYRILAYEVLHALRAWYNTSAFDALYDTLAAELGYAPVLSRIVRQEDWEKALGLLMGFKANADKVKSKPVEESKARVVYYFTPQGYKVQPVLQTKQAKGWSAGRNVAIKTFFGLGVKGMTEQDIRIAKTVKHHYEGYYEDIYEFSSEVYPALVGHPYVFLANTRDVPVELVSATPTITVAKYGAGYRLSADVTHVNESIFVRKETNTRFCVYNLTARQREMLSILATQNIVVPESGKDKLVALLGTFSAEGMTVHSDLVAEQNSQVEIREVEADARIRVQLLPLGDGLKAELFVKPFGTRPPYCKPGRGGRVLVANEGDVQLQARRDFAAETSNESALLDAVQSLETLNLSDDLLSFSDPLDSLHLLDILQQHAGICVAEWPEGERFRLRGTAGIGRLSMSVSSGIGWFEVDGELRVDESTVLSLQQLMALTATGHGRFVELSAGEFLALSSDFKKQLDELRMYSTTEKGTVHLNRAASVALNDFFDNVGDLRADKQWHAFRKNVQRTRSYEAPIPPALSADLRPYQEEGFRWLARLAEWGGGACLADDMGLGKTVQALALLLHRARLGAGLVVCPVSVIGNWVAEAQRFAPSLNVKTLGASGRREALQGLGSGDLLITSYGLLQSEEKLMAEPQFATAILDEAHVIKNYATKTSKATMQLRAAFRMALTGTPIQNHLGEIWNLFNFVNPGLLGSMAHFNATFAKADDEQARRHLKKLLSPFILRRTKSAVLDELPAKTEIVKKVSLSDDEMAFYEALRRTAIENISGAEAANMQVLAEITRLRLACCNPRLIDPEIGIGSAKMLTFLNLADELRGGHHRALVFSQFVSHLALVRSELNARGITYQYLDGSTPAKQREDAVRRFQAGEGDLFLISLKAGGLGLNLTAADYVIHLDPWWNPAIEDQASDRAHRIGQQRPVTIYRLVAEGTIEEKIIRLHATKRAMAESLLEGSDRAAAMSVEELMEIIRGE